VDRKALRVQCSSQEVLEPSRFAGLLPPGIRPPVLTQIQILSCTLAFFFCCFHKNLMFSRQKYNSGARSCTVRGIAAAQS